MLKLKAVRRIWIDEATFVDPGQTFNVADPERAIQMINDGHAEAAYGADVDGPDETTSEPVVLDDQAESQI